MPRRRLPKHTQAHPHTLTKAHMCVCDIKSTFALYSCRLKGNSRNHWVPLAILKGFKLMTT